MRESRRWEVSHDAYVYQVKHVSLGQDDLWLSAQFVYKLNLYIRVRAPLIPIHVYRRKEDTHADKLIKPSRAVISYWGRVEMQTDLAIEVGGLNARREGT